MSFGPKDFKDPGERLFYESLLSSNLGDWAVRDYFQAKGQISKYFLTETHQIPVGVSMGRVQYKTETILILNMDNYPQHRMTLSSFESVAVELVKHGIDVMAYIVEELITRNAISTPQMSIDFTEPDYIKELSGLA